MPSDPLYLSDAEIPDLEDFEGKQESQFIESSSAFRDKVVDRLSFGVETFGDQMPWSKTWGHFRLRPGEVTVWAGINGHGKSQVLGQVMLWLAKTTKVLIASLEMKPEATLERMVRQMAGNANPGIPYVDQWFKDVENSLFIYDQLDTVKVDRILAMVHHAARTLKVKHIAIDSLSKCGIGPEDYKAQKDFVDRLSWAAKRYDIHIHLVHHIRKLDNEMRIPDKFDVKGAGDIVDMVDNLAIVYRNKRKEKAEVPDPEMFDSLIRIEKQRHGEWEGSITLWFHTESKQYCPDSRCRPLAYHQQEPVVWGQ